MTASPSPPRTVRVRIAVAVDYDGNWAAGGHSKYGDAELKDCIFIDNLKEGEVYHWIEADVPVPVREVAQTIEGRVCGE